MISYSIISHTHTLYKEEPLQSTYKQVYIKKKKKSLKPEILSEVRKTSWRNYITYIILELLTRSSRKTAKTWS